MLIPQLFQDPIHSFIHLERYANFPEFYDRELLGDINLRYSSFEGDPIIPLRVLEIPSGLVSVLQTEFVSPRILGAFVNSETVNFPVHPQLLEEDSSLTRDLKNNALQIRTINTEPTASNRTLFVRDLEHPYFVKTHFPKRISSTFRTISLADIERGNWITNELKRLSDSGEMPPEIGYYPEMIELHYQGKEFAGAIIRDFLTHPLQSGTYVTVPFFSLFTQDQKAKNDAPLSAQLALKHKKRLDDYVLEEIITPHLRQWRWFNFYAGICIESHSQNLSLQFDKGGHIQRLNYKDFQGRRFFPEIRQEMGHPVAPEISSREGSINMACDLSLSYDFLIGHQLYDKIVNYLVREGYDKKKIRGRIREIFHSQIPNAEKHFPKNIFYLKGWGEKRRIVEASEAPKYR